MRIRKTIFGRSKIKPNTFIGGVSATLNTPALLAAKLGISVSAISNFKIIGTDIECKITSNYVMNTSAFRDNTSITYFDDKEGKFTDVGGATAHFRGTTNLQYINLPKVQLSEANNSYFFNNNPGSVFTKALLPGTTILSQNTFGNLPVMNELDVNNVQTWYKSAINGTIGALTVLNIKKCKSFGTVGVGGRGITAPKAGMIFNVNVALLTSNAGAVNADMLYYKTNYGCVINFYDDSGNYVSTL